MIKIEDLHVNVDGKEILKGVNLKVPFCHCGSYELANQISV